MKNLSTRLIISEDQINKRLDELAKDINEQYAGQELVLVCILKGAFMFFSDLVRRLTMNPEVDFVRVASYGNNTESTKTISFSKDIEISLENKHVILVDDIVDSGRTMSFLLQQFKARGAQSIKVAALVDKSERREVDVDVHFPGFALKKGFILGYGLDYAEKYRALPGVFEVTSLQD